MLSIRNLSTLSFLGFTAVLFGAFGAHALREKLSPELFHAWQTGVEYQFYHLLAYSFCSLLPIRENRFSKPGFWFLMGIFFFSGSLYLIGLLSLIGIKLAFIGILTPLGGLFFMIGWILILPIWKFKNV